jgi:hypothetical protein
MASILEFLYIIWQHIPYKEEKKNISLCEIVFASHAKNKNVTFQNRHMEEQFFSSTSMGNS